MCSLIGLAETGKLGLVTIYGFQCSGPLHNGLRRCGSFHDRLWAGVEVLQAVEGAVELVLEPCFGAIHELDGTAGVGGAAVGESGAGRGGQAGGFLVQRIFMVDDSASRLDIRMRRQRAVAIVSTSAVSVGVEGLYSA